MMRATGIKRRPVRTTALRDEMIAAMERRLASTSEEIVKTQARLGMLKAEARAIVDSIRKARGER